MEQKRKIDLVIAFVDNNDKVWRETYINYCKKNRLQEKIVDLICSRFGGIRFIDYQLKLVQKNMPWINKIFLLLSNVEQAPKDLPSNCEIILHKQFIPEQFLPTFNSTTIEMFLWNIPNLSEHFIYANDDMLPTGELKPKDFFDDDLIKIKWRTEEYLECMGVYATQCRNAYVSVLKALKINCIENYMERPIHSFTPMIRSHCKECFFAIQKDIVPHILPFRTKYQYNQYIYPLWEHYKYGSIESDIDFLYTELDEDFDLKHQICCINCEKNRNYVKKFLIEVGKLCD